METYISGLSSTFCEPYFCVPANPVIHQIDDIIPKATNFSRSR